MSEYTSSFPKNVTHFMLVVCLCFCLPFFMWAVIVSTMVGSYAGFPITWLSILSVSYTVSSYLVLNRWANPLYYGAVLGFGYMLCAGLLSVAVTFTDLRRSSDEDMTDAAAGWCFVQCGCTAILNFMLTMWKDEFITHEMLEESSDSGVAQRRLTGGFGPITRSFEAEDDQL
eukprot:Rmarinus@m.537